MLPKFCENISVPFLQTQCSYGTLLPLVARQAVLDRQTLTIDGIYGSGEGALVEKALALILEILPNSWLAASVVNEKAERASSTIISEIGVAEIQHYGASISVPFALTDLAIAKSLRAALRPLIPLIVPVKDSIFAIGKGVEGLQLSRIGQIGIPITTYNYIDSVIDQFKHAAKDLSNKNPCGRLIILSGEPGTGKTFMVRGLVNAADDAATFVVVPPHMISALGDPDFINILIDHKRDESNDDRALVLVLEDADSALVPRGADNMHSLSGLLNLSDGLIGRALDIRIIATTNAEIKQMDDALVRDGRLCQHITTRPFSKAEAQILANKLAPGKIEVTREATLAEIYKWTGSNNLPAPAKRKGGMGF